jgi:tetratricopeptide (TPR) repeat protein
MEYLNLDISINPWEGQHFEIIARCEEQSARQVTPFPLGPLALNARLPVLRRALAQLDLAAGRAGSEDERAVEEFAMLLYRFIFSGEVMRVFHEARAAAVARWKNLRLRLRVSAPELQNVPWEVLWDILSFDLQTLKRGLFDLRVERIAPTRGSTHGRRAARPLRPQSVGRHHQQAIELMRQADAAFYSPDFARAVELYQAGLRLEPGLRQARECLTRAEACLAHYQPSSTVPPRAAGGYRRAWETYTQYRFDEALRWLNEAWLQAKDWGIAEWPEASAFQQQIERARSAYANYQEALDRYGSGDPAGAIEALEQAMRSDPLEVYRAQLAAWGRVFQLE